MSKDEDPPDKDKKKKVEEGDERVIYVDFATGRRLSKEEWSKTPEDIADELVGQEPEDFEELAVQNSIKINSLKYVAQRQQDTLDSLGEMSVATAHLAGATAYETDSNSKEIKTIWSRIMSNVSTKEFRIGIIAVIAVIVGLFAWGQSQKPKIPSYVFVATHTAVKADTKKDLIRTQQELNSVINDSSIIDHNLATIGATVGYSDYGLYVFPESAMKADGVTLQDITDAPEKTQFDTYKFIPDVMQHNPATYKAQKIMNQRTLDSIKNDPNVHLREIAIIGSYVIPAPDGSNPSIVTEGETAWLFTPLYSDTITSK